MVGWTGFEQVAPRIAAVFSRRHAATGHLCLLATVRPDGFPRISPMEPAFFEGELWLVGMSDTRKFDDLVTNPRFALHTATSDPQVTEGDAKVWGTAEDVMDRGLHERFAQALFEETGFDLRGSEFDHFFRADLVGGAAVAVDEHLDVTVWRDGDAERVIRKH